MTDSAIAKAGLEPTRRIKVAYIIGALGVGGAERQLLKKMLLLRDRGIDLVLVALSSGGTLGEEFRRHGLRVIELSRTHSMEFGRIRKLAEILRTEAPDIVHGEQYQAGAYARIAGILARVPVRIHAIRSAYPKLRRRYRVAEALLKGFTDAYMVNAQAIKERTVAHHGIDPAKVHVIPNVFDPGDHAVRPAGEVRAALGLGDASPVIGIIASLDPEKNHGLFLAFAREVRERSPGARFLLIGDGARRPVVEAEIDRLGLSSSASLLGIRRDVPDILQVLDVSVNCSIREGLCNAIIESLAAGVPVLASRVGGNPELVREGRDGELFESGSLPSMLAAYEKLAANPARYRASIAQGRDAFLARFRGDTIADEMVDIYHACLRARATR